MQMEIKRRQELQYSDKTDFKEYYKGQGGHYIIIKGSIQENDITITNIYATNI